MLFGRSKIQRQTSIFLPPLLDHINSPGMVRLLFPYFCSRGNYHLASPQGRETLTRLVPLKESWCSQCNFTNSLLLLPWSLINCPHYFNPPKHMIRSLYILDFKSIYCSDAHCQWQYGPVQRGREFGEHWVIYNNAVWDLPTPGPVFDPAPTSLNRCVLVNFYVSLTKARVTWEEGTRAEGKITRLGWTVGKSVGYFLD